MKTYIGTYTVSGGSIAVKLEDGTTYPLPRSGRNHSPTGFNWGYGGSGPAETAASILCDFFDDGKHKCDLCEGEGELAVDATEDEGGDDVDKQRCYACEGRGIKLPVSYQDFKFAVIARLEQGKDFELTGKEIEDWLAAHAAGKDGSDV